MKKTLFCILLCAEWLQSDGKTQLNNTDLCHNPACFCQLDEEQTEYPYVSIDCSFNEPSSFSDEYTLPDRVKLLELSANNLTSLNQISSILHSDSVNKLFLNRNLLENISIGVLNLPALTFLDLSDNLLSNLDAKVFDNLRSLKYLNLASNNFKAFTPANFKSLNVLEVLILDENPLGEYLMEFNLFRENGPQVNADIEAVSLENVHLMDLPENFFADAFNLRHLRLSRNALTAVPELPFTLEYLDLSDNPIKELDDEDFSNTPALKELMLNNLDVVEVPGYIFTSLKALERLELKGNRRLKTFNSLAFGQDVLDDADDFVLKALSLRGSLLSTLSEDLLEPFSHLSELDLQGNPWVCDCRITWIKKLQIPPEDTDHIRCFRPVPLYNSRLFETDDASLTCRARLADQRVVGYVVIGVALLLLGMALWIFLVLPRRYNRNVLIRNVAPGSPYSRITIDPNAAEDYR